MKIHNPFITYPADELFLTLYNDNLYCEYRLVHLYEQKVVNYILRRRFVDLCHGTYISDLIEPANIGKSFIQDKDYYINDYNIRNLININAAASLVGFKEKDIYTLKKAQILLANYNHMFLEKETGVKSKRLIY